jgi:hypothetical protein
LYDEEGCSNLEVGNGRVPECRYYEQFGRIEDEEVIQNIGL